jgi:hypothetical protein
VKVDFLDDQGTKHSITIEGYITREKVAKVLDYIELMGAAPKTSKPMIQIQSPRNIFERIQKIISSHFSDRTFVSKDIREYYGEIYGENLSLSTTSTYLSRLVDKGILIRSGSSFEWQYNLKITLA